ncbi:hypothetical protein SAMN06298216_2034 [Spirosomataceae bacterium TFI 002]|nr:hypothetical protein SAMN06298216_2034 [Spirosomataceae bacterium TFI 002]
MKAFTITVLVFLTFSTFAQKPIQFKVGLNNSLYGSGDLRGFEYYNEIIFPINGHLSWAPSIHVGSGSNNPIDNTSPRFSTTSIGTDFTVYFSPWQFEKSKIQMGVGPSIRYFNDGTPETTGFQTIEIGNSLKRVYEYYYPIPSSYVSPGFSVVLDSELKVSNHWKIGGRVSFSSFLEGQTIAQLGLSAGYTLFRK